DPRRRSVARGGGFAARRLMEPAIEGPSHRNGYRDRVWETRAGTVELRMPTLRKGGSLPGAGPHGRGGAERHRAGGHVQGVSTCAVDDLVQAMGTSASPRTKSAGCVRRSTR